MIVIYILYYKKVYVYIIFSLKKCNLLTHQNKTIQTTTILHRLRIQACFVFKLLFRAATQRKRREMSNFFRC